MYYKVSMPTGRYIDDWIRANGRPSRPMRFNFWKLQNILAHFNEREQIEIANEDEINSEL